MMLPEYREANLAEQSLQCPKCHWSGTGADAVLIDFYGITKNKEAHCPKCDEKIGIVVRDDNPPPESADELSFQTG